MCSGQDIGVLFVLFRYFSISYVRSAEKLLTRTILEEHDTPMYLIGQSRISKNGFCKHIKSYLVKQSISRQKCTYSNTSHPLYARGHMSSAKFVHKYVKERFFPVGNHLWLVKIVSKRAMAKFAWQMLFNKKNLSIFTRKRIHEEVKESLWRML